MQGLGGHKGISFSDLCMFPHVHLPTGFKTPKFEKYDGHGDPIAHLKRYCNQLRGAEGKEELLMACFGESLCNDLFSRFKQQILFWKNRLRRRTQRRTVMTRRTVAGSRFKTLRKSEIGYRKSTL